MSRVILALFALCFFCFSFVEAASLQRYDRRQIGNLQCNIDRLKIVADLAGAKSTAQTLTQQLASDAAGSQSISTVSDGISSAQSAIGQIAAALLTGQQAPAAARDQVAAGLTQATQALANITSTDAAVTQNLSKIQGQLSKAADAGNGVVTNCK
ncbi:hypothetical protein C8Q75DRAFT_808064 [Abortiporus biennis]|nr:hypothetical protein C8Q75DRAFT_808064 [Abortiporus biennis]